MTFNEMPFNLNSIYRLNGEGYSEKPSALEVLTNQLWLVKLAICLILGHSSLAAAAVLENGRVISDAISIVGEQDSFIFIANAGESVQIRVADTSNGSLWPSVALYAPSGAKVVSSHGDSVAGIELCSSCVSKLPESGTYTVLVSDQFSTGTGNYDLYFVKAPGANEGGKLVNGGVISNEIDIGDLDSFTFTASVGESVQIRVADTSNGSLWPSVAIYAPSGAKVVSSHGDSVAGIEACPSCARKLQENGTYTVLVSDQFSTGTGNYTLRFEQQTALSYAALGDSYSSGEGVFPYFDTTNILSGCHRSTRAYSTQIRVPGTTIPIANRPDAQFDFFACSGAVTENITVSGEGQNGEPPQLAPKNGVNDSRDLVTMSIGGNDAQFGPIVKFCLAHKSCNSIKPFAPYLEFELGELFPLWVAVIKTRLLEVYSELRNDTPNATTLILDYPILVSGQECAAVMVPFKENLKLSESEQAFMKDANKQVNVAVKDAAAQIGLHYVSVADHFTGHEICGTLDNWINGLVLYNPKASFHPTSRGQLEYARLANAYLESKKTGWPFGYFSTGLPRNPDPLPSINAQASAKVASAEATTALPEFGELDVKFAAVPEGCEASRDVVTPGAAIAIHGTGFAANESVTFSLAIAGEPTAAIGAASSDAEGQLNATLVMPDSLPVGAMGTLEALAAGPNGVGRLLLSLVRIEDSITVDSDGDGVPNGCDNCPTNSNPDQLDSDGDGRGDVCDVCPTEFPDDEDGDGLCAAVDACPLDPKNDADGDGICATDDNCPITSNPNQADADGDGIGDACATLVCYPVNLSVNQPGDGTIAAEPTNCGIDKYYQGTQLSIEAQPSSGKFFTGWTGSLSSLSNPLILDVSSAIKLKANFCSDTGDSDGDLVADGCDSCTSVANPNQVDTDGDKIGNACDADLNNDNIVNALDLGLFKKCFLKQTPDAQCPHPEHADFNDDGKVNSLDLGLFKKMYLKRPGPSGFINNN